MNFKEQKSFNLIQHIFFFGLLIGATILLLWLFNPLLPAIFWAIILAVIFEPVKRWWHMELKTHINIAAFLTVLTVVALVLLPLFGVGTMVFNEARSFYSSLSVGDFKGTGPANVVSALETVADYLERYGVDRADLEQRLTSFAGAASGWLAQQALTFGQGTFVFMLHLLLMLYVLFYALRDGPQMLKTLSDALPLGRAREGALFNKVGSIIRAIMKGTILIAILQGLIGGVLFWLAGIPAPAVWGTLMTVLAILPMVGPGVVWFPAGILLVVAGSVWQGVVVLVGGALAVGLVDNMLRPVLVGRDIKIPNVIIFLSGIGGLAMFGVTGFIIGPVIAGICLTLWGMFVQDYRVELKSRG